MKSIKNIFLFIKKYIWDSNFYLFFLVGMGISYPFLYFILPKSSFFYSFFMPIFMIPNYLINILLNLNKFNFLDPSHFWIIQFSIKKSLAFYIVIISSFYIAFMLIIIRGDNKRLKKNILRFFFIIFAISILTDSYTRFLSINSFKSPEVVAWDFNIIFDRIIIIITSIFILNYLYQFFNIKFVMKKSIKYFFTILELLLILYVGLTIIRFTLGPNVSSVAIILFKILIFIQGFFIFLLIELVKIFAIKLATKWHLTLNSEDYL